MNRVAWLLLAAVALIGRAGSSPAFPASDEEAPPEPTPSEVRAAVDLGVEYLLSVQNDDGSWGGVRNATFTSSFANPATYHCWMVGASGLAIQAVLEQGDGEKAESAVERGLDFLIENARLVRPAEWDVDNNWGLIYGLTALNAAIAHPRYRGTEREKELREAAQTMIEGLARYQGARGGWGYYADPDAAWRPDWGTSFTTAAAVLALLDAKELGLEVNPKVLGAGVRAVVNCRLPNGAYDYDVSAVTRHLRLESINQVKGSLGRIQVCNHALDEAGEPLPEGAIRTGVEQFFEHHKFLDVARNKPIPHEAYYANAAYFYLFGHYYAAHTIGKLPAAERREWYGKLQREVLKCQQEDGSMWDFWIASSTKAYGTAFGVMTLARTLEPAE